MDAVDVAVRLADLDQGPNPAAVRLPLPDRDLHPVVPEAHLEPGIRGSVVVAELADELWSMATWLKLDRVTVQDRGDLSRPLARAVSSSH